MASEHSSGKPATPPRKPPETRFPAPPLPQINPPLLNDGQESARDSHC